MKALVLESNAQLVYRDTDLPEAPTEQSLLVRIVAAGICGSDLHRGFENGAYHYPLIMGHELSGVVEDPGPSARSAPGDRVAIFPLLPCHRCGPCQTGDYAQCTDYDYFGSRRHGGFAEYLRVPEENLFRIPDSVDSLHAAMAEPCAVALHGVRRMRTEAGMSGAVIGGGPIGNMVAQWLGLSGCDPVIVVDVDEGKLAIAREMGFAAIDGSRADPVEAIHRRTGGGADCVVEAVGLPQTFLQALAAAARFGQVVFMGNISGTLAVGEAQVSSILRRELRVSGTWNSKMTPRGNDDWSTALSHMDRDLIVTPLISHTPPLAEGAEVFRRMVERSEPFGRVVFRIGSS